MASLLDPPVIAGTVVVAETGEGRFTEVLLDGRHRLLADEPVAQGGGDSGPNPYELLLMALGSCTAMTLRLYAERKGWPLARVVVRLSHDKRHVEDAGECEGKPRLLDHIERTIELEGALEPEQRQRLLEIANRCPVHRTLTASVAITTRLAA